MSDSHFYEPRHGHGPLWNRRVNATPAGTSRERGSSLGWWAAGTSVGSGTGCAARRDGEDGLTWGGFSLAAPRRGAV